MAKYIDAEKLIAEIERRKELLENGTAHTEVMKRVEGVLKGYDSTLDIIDSLQQEQPEVDLEKEIIRYYYANLGMIISPRNTKDIVANIARHFYELGLNLRKEECSIGPLEQGCSTALIRPLTIKATMKKSEREGYYVVHSDCKIGNGYLSGYGVTQKRAREDFEESIREAMFENVNIEYHE